MNAHVQDLYDYVAIMDYRNHAEGSDGILAHAAEELAYADAHGKTVVIGLETGDAEPAKVTFHGLGPAVLDREMNRAERQFRTSPSFRGFALHHLRTWMRLLESTPTTPSGPP